MLGARRLATAAARLRGPALARVSFWAQEGPSVRDVTVHINFVDEEGSRATVPGRVGQTLHEVATTHEIDIGAQVVGDRMFKIHSERWTEDLFGEGPQLGFDHVMIPKDWMAKLPPRVPQEVELLATVWDPEEITESSRLACMIPITPELDGMTVYLPPRVCDDAP